MVEVPYSGGAEAAWKGGKDQERLQRRGRQTENQKQNVDSAQAFAVGRALWG